MGCEAQGAHKAPPRRFVFATGCGLIVADVAPTSAAQSSQAIAIDMEGVVEAIGKLATCSGVAHRAVVLGWGQAFGGLAWTLVSGNAWFPNASAPFRVGLVCQRPAKERVHGRTHTHTPLGCQ